MSDREVEIKQTGDFAPDGREWYEVRLFGLLSKQSDGLHIYLPTFHKTIVVDEGLTNAL